MEQQSLEESQQDNQHSNAVWMILADAQGIADPFIQQAQDVRCILVTRGESFSQEDNNHYVIQANNSDHYRQLLHTIEDGLDEHEQLTELVYLWGLDMPASAALTATRIAHAQQQEYANALTLTQALLAQENLQPKLWMITQGAVAVNEPTASVMQSLLWGFGKVFALEHPHLWGGLIDIDAEGFEDQCKALVDECLHTQEEDQIAYRAGERYVTRLTPYHAPTQPALTCTAEASYLITDGQENFGLHIANFLADQGARHIMLVARSTPNEATQESIAALQAKEVNVHVYSLDITDTQAVEQFFTTVLPPLPPLKGVFHTAGIGGELMPIETLSMEECEAVLQAKTVGTWNLHTATKDLSLKYFVCFSSIASVWGSAYQSHYASANQFLDAFASYRQGLGLPSHSINWGPWSGGGLATEEGIQQLAQMGVKALSPTSALQTLHMVLPNDTPQVVVSDMDWAMFKPIHSAKRIRHVFDRIETPVTQEDSQETSVFLLELESSSPQERDALLIHHLQQTVAQVLGFASAEDVAIDAGFFDLGMDSLMAVELRNRLQTSLQCALPSTLSFDYPDIKKLHHYLAKDVLAFEDISSDVAILQERKSFHHVDDQPIAIIGVSGRFPNHKQDVSQFWQALQEGQDCIEEIPSSRWDVNAFYDPDPQAPGKMYIRQGGFVGAVDQFDPSFFGMSPKEALSLDPHQRLLLETSWEALEAAGQNPALLQASRTGVFVGVSNSGEYINTRNFDSKKDVTYFGTGNVASTAAGRLSYSLGLQGPCMAIDTACSSSLVAIHQACQSIRSGESTLAIAGGVNLLFSPWNTVMACKTQMLALDSHCKTFDASADGYVRSEGCGMVILKRLDDAMADSDPVLAVLRGSAVNQDGASSGLTVPNGPAQEAVIRDALASGQLTPGDIDYIEAHGTGTALGDPIEIGALHNVFGQDHDETNPLIVGSVKTNIGHLEAAAGVAGLVKTILALQHETIPAHLHLTQPNPHIDWDQMSIQIPTETQAWQRNGRMRRAGVSSFGFSGTNAHVIVEEAPQVEEKVADYVRPYHLLTLSAKSEVALGAIVQQYLDYSKDHDDVSLNDIGYTSQVGRAHFDYRLSVVADSHEQLQQRLDDYLHTGIGNGIQQGQSVDAHAPAPVFLFTGQGSQVANMGHELYETAPVFKQAIDDCAQHLKDQLDHSLFDLLWADHTELLDQTQYTQPALFALEYALAKLWQSWGIHPTAVMGHSVGEYVAACVADVFSLEDALDFDCCTRSFNASLACRWWYVGSAVRCRQTINQYLSN